MVIERQYKVWMATCMGKDSERPSLDYVSVTRVGESDLATADFINNYPQDDITEVFDGVAVATNGYILAAVPVVMGADDVDGLVHWSHIKKAFSVTKVRDGDPSVKLGLEFVTLGDGSQWPRFNGTVTDNTVFPDFSTILPDVRPHLDSNHGVFHIDAVEMGKVCGAVASKCRSHEPKVRMVLIDDTNASPILVEPYGKKVRDRIGLPIGLQMPLVANRGYYSAWISRQATLKNLED